MFDWTLYPNLKKLSISVHIRVEYPNSSSLPSFDNALSEVNLIYLTAIYIYYYKLPKEFFKFLLTFPKLRKIDLVSYGDPYEESSTLR